MRRGMERAAMIHQRDIEWLRYATFMHLHADKGHSTLCRHDCEWVFGETSILLQVHGKHRYHSYRLLPIKTTWFHDFIQAWTSILLTGIVFHRTGNFLYKKFTRVQLQRNLVLASWCMDMYHILAANYYSFMLVSWFHSWMLPLNLYSLNESHANQMVYKYNHVTMAIPSYRVQA